MSEELWKWSAVDLARGIRTRQISSREAVEACLDRAEAVNPQLNAIVESAAEAALDAASAADRAVADGDRLGALHGVPITIKVNTNEVGYATTNGVAALQDTLATVDDPQVNAFRRSGAISIGRTNTPAFSFRWFTENELYGPTSNPRNPGLTAGGSSGGAGAAVAAGMGPIGHANDIGGSIRFPAACCGVVGLRPSMGRVAAWYGDHDVAPPLSFQLFLVQGAITRTIEDARIALEVLATDDRRDPLFVPAPIDWPDSDRLPRAAIVSNPVAGFSTEPTAEVAAALELAASWLRDAGYEVDEISLPALGEASRNWWPLGMTEFAKLNLETVREIGGEGINRFVDHIYEILDEEFGEVGLKDYIDGYAQRVLLLRRMQEIQEKYPILLTPASAEKPFAPGEDLRSAERLRELLDAQWPQMSVPYLGVPAITVPVTDENDIPLSVQMIGRRFREDQILAAGAVLEARSAVKSPIDPLGHQKEAKAAVS